jgi:hypothetical protein
MTGEEKEGRKGREGGREGKEKGRESGREEGPIADHQKLVGLEVRSCRSEV